MKPNIDFGECLKDSPRFRAGLEETEADLDLLESKLDRLVKLCSGMIEAGKAFNNANSLFIVGVKDVAGHFHDDGLVSMPSVLPLNAQAALNRFTHILTELQKYNNILLDQAHRSICKNLNNFIKNDIRKVKDTRRQFEKVSDEMDAALTRNSQAARSKPHECDETNNLMTAMRSHFGYTALDYVFQVNLLHSKKRYDVLSTMLSYMHAQNAFYHQGYDLVAGDFEPYMKQVAAQIEELNQKATQEKKLMEERHTLVQQREETLQSPPGSGTVPTHEQQIKQLQLQQQQALQRQDGDDVPQKMEGYLFKRTTNAFKSWVRRWFVIQNNQLVYRKRSKDSLTIMEEDLRLCTVRPNYDVDRRYCFDVLSPTRSHLLQADSESECQAWISAIQAGVTTAYSHRPSQDSTLGQLVDTPPCSSSPTGQQAAKSQESPNSADGSTSSTSTSPTHQEAGSIKKKKVKSPDKNWQKPIKCMDVVLAVAGNTSCADCGSRDPRWASINLGITLCIECSGIHRSFGVHLSKVRSLTLDAWEPEIIRVMKELGNTVVNRVYEANVDSSVPRATPTCSRSVRETWIRAKFVQKLFVAHLPHPEEVTIATDHPGEEQQTKRWSVYKKKRRSPSKSETPATVTEEGEESGAELRVEPGAGTANDRVSNLTVGTIKKSASCDSDSGLGGSTNDVLVFGAVVHSEAAGPHAADLYDSDTGSEPDPDQRSTTSYEDFSKLHPDILLYKAAQARNLPVMMEALGQGADPNWRNAEEDGRTALMRAVDTGSMAPVEFLLLNGAKVDIKDQRGRTPLHHATIHGHTAHVCQLLKRRANQHAVDENGQDPLAIAVANANADIVTLLRLTLLNEEMRETEGMYGGDDTFNEVFRDFTHMANNAPEKLIRK